MIASIDPSTAEATRNHAIVETLYGCGLRVSELVSLEIGRIYAAEGYLVIRGKGSKERLVLKCRTQPWHGSKDICPNAPPCR